MNKRLLSYKALLVQDLIVDNKIDILGLCETWLKPDEFLALNEATPPNFISSRLSRESKKGGGLALISHSKLKLKPKKKYTFTSFEVLLNSQTNKTSFRLFCLSYGIPSPRSVLESKIQIRA